MSQQLSATEIIPYLFCGDVGVTMDWLARMSGFVELSRHDTERGTIHGEMSLDGCRVMLGVPGNYPTLATPARLGAATQGVFVYIDGLLAHHANAVAQGGTPDGPPTDHGYGLTYTIHDPDGHPWYFTERPKPGSQQ